MRDPVRLRVQSGFRFPPNTREALRRGNGRKDAGATRQSLANEMLVKWTWRRSWPIVALAAAALAVVVVHLAVNRLTRESPNHSEIENGLWLGGYVSEPPRGVQAVLNLCESQDLYQVESHRWEPIA